MVCSTVRETLRQAARRMGFGTPSNRGPHILEPLLCDLNDINDPERDLRFSRKEFLLLPPEAIVESGKHYCVMHKGERLVDVLARHLEGFKESYDDVSGVWKQGPCKRVRECNPWVTDMGAKHDSEIVQYVQLPDDLSLRGAGV